MNGINVTRKEKAIFVPLPREMWRSSGTTPCTCGKCFGTGYYDTLAVSNEPLKRFSDTTWMVHYPELQPRSVMTALKAELETLANAR